MPVPRSRCSTAACCGSGIRHVSAIEDLTPTRGGYRFRLVPNPRLPVLDTAVIEEHAGDLRISGWEFNRTHWAVKDVDLYRG